jgi:hypothetical protein
MGEWREREVTTSLTLRLGTELASFLFLCKAFRVRILCSYDGSVAGREGGSGSYEERACVDVSFSNQWL